MSTRFAPCVRTSEIDGSKSTISVSDAVREIPWIRRVHPKRPGCLAVRRHIVMRKQHDNDKEANDQRWSKDQTKTPGGQDIASGPLATRE